MTKSNLDLKDIYFEYKKHKKEKETIFFIHGITGSSSAWNKYYDYFYDLGYNVLKLDIRGHGISIKKNDNQYYTIENIAEDIKKIIIENKIEKPIFITHSFATFILLEFIDKYPKIKISKIVLISPLYDLKLNLITKYLIQIGSYIFPIFKKRGYHIDYTKKLLNTTDLSLKRIIVETYNTNPKVICSLFNSVERKNYKQILTKINCPVLLIHGKKDTLSNYQTSIEMSTLIKNSKLQLYENLNHIIVLNNFNQIITDLTNFIIKAKK